MDINKIYDQIDILKRIDSDFEEMNEEEVILKLIQDRINYMDRFEIYE